MPPSPWGGRFRKGEPGTGKSGLARQVATSLDLPLGEWHVKSTTKAQPGLKDSDALSRLHNSKPGQARADGMRSDIRKGKPWPAFDTKGRAVLLIDAIDKTDLEFPNDLLPDLDRMAFHISETGAMLRATARPVVIIPSNREKTGAMPSWPLHISRQRPSRPQEDAADRREAFSGADRGASGQSADPAR